MIIKKSAGRVIGAQLTNAEKKAMDIEIKKQLAEDMKNHEIETMAIVLRLLMNHFDFDEADLKKVYFAFHEDLKDLIKRYELPADENVWLCTRELLERGIDVEQWYKESEKL